MPMSAHGQDTVSKRTVWVEMNSISGAYTVEAAREALSLRLIDRRIAAATSASPAPCSPQAPDDMWVRFTELQNGALALEVRACATGDIRLEDTVPPGETETDTLRNAAVAATVALDTAPRPAEDKGTSAPEAEQNKAAVDVPSRPSALIVLAPGAALTFKGNAMFAGFVELGVALPNRIAVTAGADFATRQRGTAVKKNQDPAEGTEVGVTDFGFRLGVSYRFDFASHWFFSPGIGLRYTHSLVENLSADKFTVDEGNPAARASAFLTLEIGRRLLRFFTVSLRLTPSITFGERRYEVRGEEAVNMGFGTVGAFVCAGVYL